MKKDEKQHRPQRPSRATTTVLAIGASIAALAASPTLRSTLSAWLGTRTTKGKWRLAAIILAVANAKNLPFAWHIRLFRSLIYHLWFQPVQLPPSALFNFIISRSHTPIWETDYNLHKSNSTYFSDVDVGRMHLVSALLRNGILGVGTRPGEEATTWSISTSRGRSPKPHSNGNAAAPGANVGALAGVEEPILNTRNMTEEEFIEVARRPGPLLIALGSVACFFHREIPPYQPYEVWTRLLTWDRKWFYMVSYFVPTGTARPRKFSLQPWRNSEAAPEHLTAEEKQELASKVYATSIATYVVKKGRLTIPPEVVLQRSGMLPPRPAHIPSAIFTPSRNTTPADGAAKGSAPNGHIPNGHLPHGLANGGISHGTAAAKGSSNTSTPQGSTVSASAYLAAATSVLENSLFPADAADGDWSWERAEEERLKGLHFAKAFDGLNALRQEFDGGEGTVLGEFGDRFGVF